MCLAAVCAFVDAGVPVNGGFGITPEPGRQGVSQSAETLVGAPESEPLSCPIPPAVSRTKDLVRAVFGSLAEIVPTILPPGRLSTDERRAFEALPG